MFSPWEEPACSDCQLLSWGWSLPCSPSPQCCLPFCSSLDCPTFFYHLLIFFSVPRGFQSFIHHPLNLIFLSILSSFGANLISPMTLIMTLNSNNSKTHPSALHDSWIPSHNDVPNKHKQLLPSFLTPSNLSSLSSLCQWIFSVISLEGQFTPKDGLNICLPLCASLYQYLHFNTFLQKHY